MKRESRKGTAGYHHTCRFSDWAAPVVPIFKTDRSLGLCWDYRVTVNQVCQLNLYLDDILVAGSDLNDHFLNLTAVLERLEKARLTLKRSKCVFAASSLEYLGHVFLKCQT